MVKTLKDFFGYLKSSCFLVAENLIIVMNSEDMMCDNIYNCLDQFSVIDLWTDLRHRAPMLGNGRGSHKVGPERTYQGIG